MRIAIDATSIPPSPAGAGVYAIELVRAMTDVRPADGYAVFSRGAWFDEAAAGRRNWRIERVTAPGRMRRLLWEQATLPGALARLGIDVLHSTHHTLPLLPMRARRIVTVHDVTFLRLPERYPFARRIYMDVMTRLSARVADAIIVPSNAVRDDLLRRLPAKPDHVHVVYEAPAERYRPVPLEQAQAVARRYVPDGPPYVLSVGSLEPGKNRARLIRAMGELRRDGLDFALLVVGQPAWGYASDAGIVRAAGMEDRVVFAGFVGDADLPALYSAAAAFAFPSLYEGFGLPVLEAMACGTPTVTSNVSATAEIAGAAALLVDPHSVTKIRDALRQLLTDGPLRERLRAAGLARAGEFSWARAARETHAVYDAVVQRKLRRAD